MKDDACLDVQVKESLARQQSKANPTIFSNLSAVTAAAASSVAVSSYYVIVLTMNQRLLNKKNLLNKISSSIRSAVNQLQMENKEHVLRSKNVDKIIRWVNCLAQVIYQHLSPIDIIISY
jgi:hypothetical protein